MLESIHVKLRVVVCHKLDQITRCKITRRVVEKHILGTRVTRVDTAAGWTGMPIIDGRVELQARVSAGPSRGRVCYHGL